jgi:hypothetical protein
LDFVDSATLPDSHRHQIVEKLLGGFREHFDPKRFLARCAQAIAAECLFTLGAKPMEQEAWAPYIQWATGRFDTDTILTFNYDLVLETLGSLTSISSFGTESVLIPEHALERIQRGSGDSGTTHASPPGLQRSTQRDAAAAERGIAGSSKRVQYGDEVKCGQFTFSTLRRAIARLSGMGAGTCP